MKNVIISVSVIMIFAIGIFSCAKNAGNNENANKKTETSTLSREGGKTTKTKVTCGGSACSSCTTPSECCQEGIIDGDKSYIQCKCTTCEMDITVSTSIAGVVTSNDTTILPNGQFEVLFYQAFTNHVSTTHPGISYSILSVEIIDDQEDQDNYFITYTYQLTGGATATVSFLYERGTNTKKKINCSGTCDCRERYILASGAVECTCSPCDMTITTINSIM